MAWQLIMIAVVSGSNAQDEFVTFPGGTPAVHGDERV